MTTIEGVADAGRLHAMQEAFLSCDVVRGAAQSRRTCDYGLAAALRTEISFASAGRIRVERRVEAWECGAVVNPDRLKNQVADSVVMGYWWRVI